MTYLSGFSVTELKYLGISQCYMCIVKLTNGVVGPMLSCHRQKHMQQAYSMKLSNLDFIHDMQLYAYTKR